MAPSTNWQNKLFFGDNLDILREHKIVDDILDVGNVLSPQDEKNYLKQINAYMKRKGIPNNQKGEILLNQPTVSTMPLDAFFL